MPAKASTRSPSEVSAKVDKTAPITRNTAPQGLPRNAVQLAFTLPKGGATSALTSDGKARMILRVADVIPAPAPTAEQAANLKAELARQLQNDVLAEYLSRPAGRATASPSTTPR